MQTIMERDNETTEALIIKFAHALCTANDVTIRTMCNRIIAIYRNDESMADVVKIARNELRKMAR